MVVHRHRRVHRHSLILGWHGQAKRRHVVAKTCRRPPAASLGMAPAAHESSETGQSRKEFHPAVGLPRPVSGEVKSQ